MGDHSFHRYNDMVECVICSTRLLYAWATDAGPICAACHDDAHAHPDRLDQVVRGLTAERFS